MVGHAGDVVADAPRRALAVRTVAALLPSGRQNLRLGDEEIEELLQNALGVAA